MSETRPQSLWLEDIEVGQHYRTTEHLLKADEIIEFASRYDPQLFDLSEEAPPAPSSGPLLRVAGTPRRSRRALSSRVRFRSPPASSAPASSWPGRHQPVQATYFTSNSRWTR